MSPENALVTDVLIRDSRLEARFVYVTLGTLQPDSRAMANLQPGIRRVAKSQRGTWRFRNTQVRLSESTQPARPFRIYRSHGVSREMRRGLKR
ncbi:hypothetical protein SAMN05421753_114115 [Planctomicrobium piriforme]|uniref:Uncharacterized protein n=1 Tax=Planctomicrobium piriforme TaxID=1576369 RepID=A0A1I3MVC5_9PLAN|nr:hypothetical protein SAMN05421753_114115 [Planctomicrobium piriforme]